MKALEGTRTCLVNIGNSRGVRIPKALLEQSGLEGELRLIAEPGRIVIEKVRHPREGWEEAAKQLAAAEEDWSNWLEAPLTDDSDLPWDEKAWK